MIFEFEKPIYGSTFSIYDKWLKIAKRKNMTIIAKSEFGIATYTVDEWLKGAKKIEKVHNFPDNPMVMYSRSILPDIKKRNKRKKLGAKKEPEITQEDYKTGAKVQAQLLGEVLRQKGLIK